MAEMVWTTITIGGRMTQQTADALQAMIDEEHWEQGEDVKNGETLVLATNLNYGNHEELDAFAEKHGLDYLRHWCAQSGVFDAGVTRYFAAQKTWDEIQADDNNEPVIGIQAFNKMLADGMTPTDIRKWLESFRDKSIPKIEIVEPAALGKKRFTVELIETVRYSVEIEATNEDEAKADAVEQFAQGELGEGNGEGVTVEDVREMA
jgi:hypothetical protein